MQLLPPIEPPGKGKPGKRQLWMSLTQSIHAQKEVSKCLAFTNQLTTTSTAPSALAAAAAAAVAAVEAVTLAQRAIHMARGTTFMRVRHLRPQDLHQATKTWAHFATLGALCPQQVRHSQNGEVAQVLSVLGMEWLARWLHHLLAPHPEPQAGNSQQTDRRFAGQSLFERQENMLSVPTIRSLKYAVLDNPTVLLSTVIVCIGLEVFLATYGALQALCFSITFALVLNWFFKRSDLPHEHDVEGKAWAHFKGTLIALLNVFILVVTLSAAAFGAMYVAGIDIQTLASSTVFAFLFSIVIYALILMTSIHIPMIYKIQKWWLLEIPHTLGRKRFIGEVLGISILAACLFIVASSLDQSLARHFAIGAIAAMFLIFNAAFSVVAAGSSICAVDKK